MSLILSFLSAGGLCDHRHEPVGSHYRYMQRVHLPGFLAKDAGIAIYLIFKVRAKAVIRFWFPRLSRQGQMLQNNRALALHSNAALKQILPQAKKIEYMVEIAMREGMISPWTIEEVRAGSEEHLYTYPISGKLGSCNNVLNALSVSVIRILLFIT